MHSNQHGKRGKGGGMLLSAVCLAGVLLPANTATASDPPEPSQIVREAVNNPEDAGKQIAAIVVQANNLVAKGGLEAAWLTSSNACPVSDEAKYLRAFLLNRLQARRTSKKALTDTYSFKTLAAQLSAGSTNPPSSSVLFQIGLFLQREGDHQAVSFFAMAADKGHPMAQWRLAQCYLHGQGTQHDLAKAKEYARKAAQAGIPDAMDYLAKIK